MLIASNLDLTVNVRGIIADCGFTSAHDIWKHVAEENLHLHSGLYSLQKLIFVKNESDTEAYQNAVLSFWTHREQ